jgi:hypothetical protein
MSILDDAIREHLELKRAHGADATELKKLEDEAFGPPARPDEPDPLAEAPTEFLATEGAEGEPSGRRVPNIADLQEAPELPKEDADAPEEPVPEAQPEPEPSHSTGEREAIAEQPTEMFDVEADIENGKTSSPPDEEPAAEEEEDDFFSEQRLSDELNQALEAPITDEPAAPTTDEHAVPATDEDVEDDEDDDEEYEDEDEPPPAAGDEHEDVLEDTPDFLEDTPEDDDLWFEQRPPKDFDFDD